MRLFNLFLKRVFDIAVSLVALVILTVIPVMLVIPLVILFKTVLLVFKRSGTEVKAEYRGVSRFSKHYAPENEQTAFAEERAQPHLVRVLDFSEGDLLWV